MKNLIFIFQILTFILFSCFNIYSQKKNVKISQSIDIQKVIEIKKEINKNISMLRIQIYNGNREEAQIIKEKFERHKIDSIVDIVYETPNYKIWVGHYINQLEADKKLLEIKKYFIDAFIFRPIIKPVIEQEIKEN
tara:strand:- start:83 stop:490 length:408 start_codon:yes stop_codon:yes gene_type:complete